MNSKLLHTPEGVRDIYNGECKRKLSLTKKVNHCISTYGFLPIQTPTFEFFDIFGKEVGTTSSRDLFKFFDREGNTLVLRPDITPSIARAAAKYYSEDIRPIRLSYEGNVFVNDSSYRGRLKESTQIGGELIGDGSIVADAEIISLICQVLLSAGLKEFQISIGHSQFFDGLVDAAGFTEEETDTIRNLISNKNVFGVEEFLDQKALPEDLVRLFGLVCKLYKSTEDLEEALCLSDKYPRIKEALTYLYDLHKLLVTYGVEEYISFEPGLLSNYKYYTGIIFSGYTYLSGEPIVKGGRYDKLMSYFGKEAPAIGFAFSIDTLLLALERNDIRISDDDKRNIILYHDSKKEEAILLALNLRKEGQSAELVQVTEESLSTLKDLYKKHNVIEF